MYNNIRHAVTVVAQAFESQASVDAIVERACEPFSEMELRTINEHIVKYRTHQLLDMMHPDARQNLSELMSDFLGCVQIEI